MQVGVNPLNSEIFFKKLRKPLDDRFLLFRAVAAAKAGDGRQNLVNIRAGRFERTVAERIGDEALRLRGLQLFFRDDLLQLLLFLLLQQIEGNLIYPHVVGNSVGLPSIWVLAAVTVGGNLMGIVGMLIFIPLVSVFYSLFREFVYLHLEMRHIKRVTKREVEEYTAQELADRNASQKEDGEPRRP